MKKRSLIFIVFALVCGLLAAWLVNMDRGEKEVTQKPAPSPVISQAPTAEEPQTSEAPKTIDIPTHKLKRYEADAKEALRSTREAYKKADKGSSSNVVLSSQGVRDIVLALGQAGYPAVDYFGKMDMQQPQQLLDFGAAINAGQDAEAVYYVVHDDGSIHANNLIRQGGLSCVFTVSVEWDGRDPRVYSSGQHELSTLKMTDKGWLICTRAGAPWATNGNAYTFLRVKPYDATLRQLTEKYMSGNPYAENDLFTISWDRDSIGRLDMSSLFVFLYSRYYGTVPMTSNTLGAVAGFKSVPNSDLYIAPSSQFEEVISYYLGIDESSVAGYSDYSSKYGGYLVLGSDQSYYNDLVPKLPFPEVTSYITNGDGSITLMVDAVYPAYETDCAFSHELTVMDTEDGFYYVSNYMHRSEGDIMPPRVLASERKNQIATLK